MIYPRIIVVNTNARKIRIDKNLSVYAHFYSQTLFFFFIFFFFLGRRFRLLVDIEQ